MPYSTSNLNPKCFSRMSKLTWDIFDATSDLNDSCTRDFIRRCNHIMNDHMREMTIKHGHPAELHLDIEMAFKIADRLQASLPYLKVMINPNLEIGAIFMNWKV